jgi:hypothetical protein
MDETGGKAGGEAKGPGLLETIAANEEKLGALAERVAKMVDGYVSKREKHVRDLEAGRSRVAMRITLWAFVLIGGMLVGTWVLTRERIVSGEAFAFLVGSLVGSVVTFLMERIAVYLVEPPLEEIVE